MITLATLRKIHGHLYITLYPLLEFIIPDMQSYSLKSFRTSLSLCHSLCALKLSLTLRVCPKPGITDLEQSGIFSFLSKRISCRVTVENWNHLVPLNFPFQVIIDVIIMTGYGDLIVKYPKYLQ